MAAQSLIKSCRDRRQATAPGRRSELICSCTHLRLGPKMQVAHRPTRAAPARPAMHSNLRKLLTCILLATYASISLLGEGLHSLMPEAGHQHHHGLYVVTVNGERPHHDDHHASRSGVHAAVAVSSCGGDAESHICEICQFLFQSISQPVEMAAPIDWQPLVDAAVSLPEPIYSPASVGPQAPRGPPLLVA